MSKFLTRDEAIKLARERLLGLWLKGWVPPFADADSWMNPEEWDRLARDIADLILEVATEENKACAEICWQRESLASGEMAEEIEKRREGKS